MTNTIKNAIETFEDFRDNGYEPRSSNGELFDIAIRFLKVWEEVLHELEEIYSDEHEHQYGNGIHKAIDIINQKLEKIEKGGAENGTSEDNAGNN